MQWDCKVLKDFRDRKESRDYRVQPDLSVLMALPASQDPRDPRDCKVNRAPMGNQVCKGPPEWQANKVRKARRDPRVDKGRRGYRDLWEGRAPLALREHEELRVRKELPACKALREQRVPRASLPLAAHRATPLTGMAVTGLTTAATFTATADYSK